ncbi:MAG: cupin domain-containing protein, partial [Bacteroidales bacterium]|nr:cupin domain-containing protein [Bacteroidales bacterium]
RWNSSIKFVYIIQIIWNRISCTPFNHIAYIIEGQGALVNEAGEETLLKAGDFAHVNPSEKHQYRNKGDQPFKMICGVPKEFE